MLSKEQVRNLIANYSPDAFVRILKAACAPAAFVPIGKNYRFPDASHEPVCVLGVVKDLTGENGLPAPLLVADVPFPNVLTERSSRIRQFKLAKKVLEHFAATPPLELVGVIAQGVFVFHDAEGRFRVSLVTATPEKGKFNWSKARRQSFYVTNDPDANATFVQRMCMDWSTLKGLKNAFSVEKLTKEFYDQLFNWYDRACDDERVEYPNGLSTDADNREDKNRKHLIRLITRLMFVWFLKQKGLVPAVLFDEEKLRRILKDFDPTDGKQHQYYRAILQNLFFATLNSEIDERCFAEESCRRTSDGKNVTPDHGIKTKYRYADEFAISKQKVLDLFRPIPFLNGGLFECLDRDNGEGKEVYYDGFSQQERHRDHGTLTWAHVPNDLFFAPEYGIIPLLKRYNFTVEENSPGDEDVALDPELLGKVFENLLGAFNPETQEVVRNSTGSFYTPREIVNYMVDESLVAYLSEKANADEKTVRALVADGVRPADEAMCERLVKALETAKVLDPACGSGAFPMGALLKMTELLRILNRLPDDANLYDLKLKLIENCIFGGDIQEIAVQISKLRVFISLVCEQKPDWKKRNYGINTLPNLETKFVAVNSLIGLERESQGDLFFDTGEIKKTKDALWNVRRRHFRTKTRREKNELRRQDKILREKLAAAARELGYSEESTRLMASWDPYNQNVHAEFFDPEWMFNVEGGFDIVIGNPPYIKEPENRKAFDGFREQSPYYMGKMDIWHGFACIGIDLLVNDGILCFIAQNNWTTNAGAKKMRNKVLADARILQLLDFNDYMVFESADVQTMVMLFRKAQQPETYSFDLRTLRLGATKPDFLEMLANIKAPSAVNLSPTIDRKKMKNHLLTFSDNDAILGKIQLGKTYLLTDEIAQGIVPNPDVVNTRNSRFVGANHIGEGVFVVSSNTFSSVRSCEKKYLKPLYEPSDLKRYCPLPQANKRIIYITKGNWKNDAPTLLSHLSTYRLIMEQRRENLNGRIQFFHLHWARDERFFQSGEKILAVRKCESPLFCFTQQPAYVMMAFNVIQTKRWDMKFLTGVLNSKLVAFWLRHKGKMQGGNYQVDKEPLLGIPLPDLPQAEQQPIASIVDAILVVRKANPTADTSALEDKIDKLVYELYGIKDEKEIAIIEGRDGKGADGAGGGETTLPRASKTGNRTQKAKKRTTEFEEEF